MKKHFSIFNVVGALQPLLVAVGFTVVSLTPQLSHANRTLRPPAIRWHDWILATDSWCTAGGYYQKGVEITVTNTSRYSQTVRVDSSTISGSVIGMSSSHPEKLVTGFVSGDTPSGATNPISTPLAMTKTIAPGESTFINFYVTYVGPGGPGDWHLTGALDFLFTISEDRGAVTASINTNMEDTCSKQTPIIGYDPANQYNSEVTNLQAIARSVGMLNASLRNVSKTYAVNGARAF